MNATPLLLALGFSLLCHAGAEEPSLRNVYDSVLTSAGQADFRQTLNLNRRDIGRMVLEQVSRNLQGVRDFRENLKNSGLEASASYEVTLAPGVTVTIAAEHLPAMSLWNGQSTPDFPFKFTVKNPDADATGQEASLEIAYNPEAKDTYGVESIQFEGKVTKGPLHDRVTVKVSGPEGLPVVEVDYGKGASTPSSLQEATGFKLTAEQNIGLDSSRGADDFYTEDMERSDYAVVRWTEDFISRIKWGLSGTLEHEKDLGDGSKIKTNVKYTFGTDWIRDWWTRRLFAEADEAARRLDEQLTHMEQWRRSRIEREAVKWGIDPTGKTNNQLIREVGDRRRAAGVNTPVFGPGSQAVPPSAPSLPPAMPPVTPPSSSRGRGLKPFR